jgi:6-phosphogluconolactonase
MGRYVAPRLLSFALVSLAACGDGMATQPRASRSGLDPASSRDERAANGTTAGAVFVSTNGARRNSVVAFVRHADGNLTKIGEFGTGGRGIGGSVDPLQSQGALALSEGHKTLFVVNAGSSSVSSFSVANDASLRLLGSVNSEGNQPISLAINADRLYVLNADNSVSAFAVHDERLPSPITRAALSLGPVTDGPSTIAASRDGKFLFVTQRAANAIDVIRVAEDGSLTHDSRSASAGGTPFGFAVTPREQLVVSEASGDAPNGAVSSYDLSKGQLTSQSRSVSTHQAATCWLILSHDSRFAFAANAGSGSVSAYAVAPDASLTLLVQDGRSGMTNGDGATPLDLGLSSDGHFLYVLQTGTGSIGAFRVSEGGRLTTLPDTPGLSTAAGYQGLAAF